MNTSQLRILIPSAAFLFAVILSFFLLPFSPYTIALFWFFLFVLIFILSNILTLATAAPKRQAHVRQQKDPKNLRDDMKTQSITIMTLNIAHGRGNGLHQFFHSTARLKTHLDTITDLIKRYRCDIVALQETDGPTFWSGGIDQTDYIARKADLTWSLHSNHVAGCGIYFGTAILSRFTLNNAETVTFKPSPPTFSKGLTRSTVQIDANHAIDVVSLQLDFSRKSIQRDQIDRLITTLRNRKNPLILAGDFNSDWTADNSIVQRLCTALQLTAYAPTAKKMFTFPALQKRCDWVLISHDLSFVQYETLHDVISDHYAVVAKIALKN